MLAGAPAALSSRCAARPVGDARRIRARFARTMSTTARRMVVFPVPGPPVMMENFERSVFSSAARCWPASSKPARFSAHSMAASTLIDGSKDSVFAILAAASAMRFSAPAEGGSWQAGPVTPRFHRRLERCKGAHFD